MRIIQVLGSLGVGNAVGNHVRSLDSYFKEQGFNSKIYAKFIDPRLTNEAETYDKYQEKNDDIIIYHFCDGIDLNEKIYRHKCKVIFNYHNITPPKYFEGYNQFVYDSCKKGYEDIKKMANFPCAVITPSFYNLHELEKMGYTCPLYCVPILIKFEDYKIEVDHKIYTSLKNDKFKNIIFIGRIAPNKGYEYILDDFYYYNKFYNNDSRLILIGSEDGFENYKLKLKKYIKKLNLSKNVLFPGHIRFTELLAYLKASDLFLCESEHEGFCVPLVEAMNYSVPVVAYNSSAVAETLGKGGIVVNQHDGNYTASLINEILNDDNIIQTIKNNQIEELKRFDTKIVAKKYLDIIEKIAGGNIE